MAIRTLWAALALALCACTALDTRAAPRDAEVMDARDPSGDARVMDGPAPFDAPRPDARPADAVTPDGAAVSDARAPDAPPGPCPTARGVPDCADPRCNRMPCNDGRNCTTADTCMGGACIGTDVVCASDECTTERCADLTGSCALIDRAADGTPCSFGRCCFGRCSTLSDNGNCGGCNLACDEESCTASGPPRCSCAFSCPMGQACIGGLCTCRIDGECAAGQICTAGTCSYP